MFRNSEGVFCYCVDVTVEYDVTHRLVVYCPRARQLLQGCVARFSHSAFGEVALLTACLLTNLVSFSEVIPQSLFTRHGLYLGAKMAGFTQLLIYALV